MTVGFSFVLEEAGGSDSLPPSSTGGGAVGPDGDVMVGFSFVLPERYRGAYVCPYTHNVCPTMMIFPSFSPLEGNYPINLILSICMSIYP